MLRSTLIHPQILETLGGAGHGSRVLIADGNYPFTTGSAPSARVVYLNLAPGLLTATDVLRVLVTAIPVEAADVMIPDDMTDPPIFQEFEALLPGIHFHKRERFDFYEAARSPDTALVLATGEQRIYATILLTIGIIPPPDA